MLTPSYAPTLAPSWSSWARSFALVLLLLLEVAAARGQGGPITLVQHASKDAGITRSSSLAFSTNNTTGNWLAVVIRAGRSGQVFTVTDARGNAYRPAIQFNVTADTPNGDTLGIFYAENIAGGANTVTVSDTISNGTLRFAILEYSGVATANSLDVSLAGQGTSAAPNSGNVTTAASGDLLLGAILTANSANYAAGSGYAMEERAPAPPNAKLLVEDRIQVVAGSASAGAVLGAPDQWGAAVAGFKAAGGGATPPSITSLNPMTAVAGTLVTIAGTNFGASQGTSTLMFNGTAATPTGWSPASIVAPVPSAATTGNVVVTVGGLPSNGILFSVIPTPGVTSLTPSLGSVSSAVTIAGTNFGTTQGASSVTFNGSPAAVTAWSATTIIVTVPVGAVSGNVMVTVGGVASNSLPFTVTPISVSVAPATTSVSTGNGAGFTATVQNDVQNKGVTWSLAGPGCSGSACGTVSITGNTTSTLYTAPAGMPSPPTITLTATSVADPTKSGSAMITITQAIPNITSLNPSAGTIGTPVTITGTNFGTTQGSSVVTFNGINAAPTSWSATSVTVPTPAGATTGNVVVSVGGLSSNGVTFTVSATGPSIASLNPPAAGIGAPVTLAGSNFGATQGTSTVTFNGTVAIPTSWSDTSISVPVPNNATTGNVVVVSAGVASNGVSFTVLPPSIAGVNPTSALAGAPLTITGANFGPTQGTSTVQFSAPVGMAFALPTSWNATTIMIPVPPGAATGGVTVTVSNQTSNAVPFTMIPSVANLNPSSGPAATQVTITGTGFGASQGSSTITFNGTNALPASWSNTGVVVAVPAGAATGNVVVTVGGMASSGVNFTVTLPPPGITSLSLTSAVVGTPVTITGTNFGAAQGSSAITFNGVTATPTSWSSSSITAAVPPAATTGNVVVTVAGVASNGLAFAVLTPGVGIALIQHASKDAGITTSSILAFPANNSAGNWIAVVIRAGRSGQLLTVKDSNGNIYRQALQYNVTVDAPNGDTLGIFYAENIAGGPNTVTVSDSISSGTLRFAVLEYSGVLAANSLDVVSAGQGTNAAPNSGNVTTTVGGDLLLGAIMTANGANFTAGGGYAIEERAPAIPGTKVIAEDQIQTVAGSASAGANLNAPDNWGAALAAFRAAGGGIAAPVIANLNPSAGVVGTALTINGINFGATQGTSTVMFNGTPAIPTSWSATAIVAPVPSTATTGNVVVTVGGVSSNGVNFGVGPVSVSITPAAPVVAEGTTQLFIAAVQNDPQNSGVAWSVSGSGCSGATCGTFSSITPTTVIYTAPGPAPTPPNVTVVATSLTDSTKSSTAAVTIGPPPPVAVSVLPASRTVSLNLTQQFTATVQYDFNNLGVTWSLAGSGCSGAACGVLSNPTSSGNAFTITYTAPSTVPIPATATVSAVSIADSTRSGSATITVSQGVPTSLGWYQIPNTMLQPICPNIPEIQATIGCQGVISAWSGGIADTSRNRLLFTGGGHQNYWGDEVYSLNLSDLTLTEITNPTVPSPIPFYTEDWGNPPTVPSAPAARETYSGLAYVAHLDKMWLFGGALARSGYQSSGLWMLDLPTLTWTRMDPTNGTQETVYTDINYADYDAQSKLVYVYISDNDVLAAYSPDTNTMTELLYQKSPGVGSHSNGVLDPKRHLFVVIGGGVAATYDLTTTPPAFTNISSQTAGCSGLQSMPYPGLAYDPVQDKIVGWAGGNTVYVFDSPTLTCTAVTYNGGPPVQQMNGTFGRWRYFPTLNLFVLVNDWKQNAFTLRLTPAP